MIIRARAYPRAALIGNPSDGYFGKTIAFTFDNFHAEIILYESPELEIQPNERDQSVFSCIASLAEDVGLYGYYGGIRLLKAAVKCFYSYCVDHQIDLRRENFTLRYHSDIPHLVGLAGSSAIITACIRALMTFYGVGIPKPELANLILAVEKDELDISAGLQDRVAQVYQGLVYMDFDKGLMESRGFGDYEELDYGKLPPLYLAYRVDLSEGSEVFHNNIRDRFRNGDAEVVDAMKFWADLTLRFHRGLEQHDYEEMARLMDSNFERRAQLYRISRDNLNMIEKARSLGASAKFTGSGGAIVGTYRDEPMFQKLCEEMETIHVRVLRPNVIK